MASWMNLDIVNCWLEQSPPPYGLVAASYYWTWDPALDSQAGGVLSHFSINNFAVIPTAYDSGPIDDKQTKTINVSGEKYSIIYTVHLYLYHGRYRREVTLHKIVVKPSITHWKSAVEWKKHRWYQRQIKNETRQSINSYVIMLVAYRCFYAGDLTHWKWMWTKIGFMIDLYSSLS